MADITTRDYAVPFTSESLSHIASLVDLVNSKGHTAQIVGVRSAFTASQHRLDEYSVRVRGTDRVHSEVLGWYPWMGPTGAHMRPISALKPGDVFHRGPGRVAHKVVWVDNNRPTDDYGYQVVKGVSTVIWIEDRKAWNHEYPVHHTGNELNEKVFPLDAAGRAAYEA